jgi:hypothetical protein
MRASADASVAAGISGPVSSGLKIDDRKQQSYRHVSAIAELWVIRRETRDQRSDI